MDYQTMRKATLKLFPLIMKLHEILKMESNQTFLNLGA